MVSNIVCFDLYARFVGPGRLEARDSIGDGQLLQLSPHNLIILEFVTTVFLVEAVREI